MDHQKRKKYSNYCLIISASLIILLIAAVWITTQTTQSPAPAPIYTTINLNTIKDGNLTGFIMVDIRTPAEYNASHVGGALNIPFGCTSCVKQDTQSLLNTTDTIVLYGQFDQCIKIAQIMDSINYHSLYILTGWEAWVDE